MNNQIEEMAYEMTQYKGKMCERIERNDCLLKFHTNAFIDCNYCKLAEHLITKKSYRKIPENIGEFSDGYHTFNELYHHRAILFSVICNMMPEKAWKSKLHDTGDMYDGMFIVGIETEHGQATYHYDIDPYWDMFKVKELEKAPKWDGHTPSDAIERIGAINTAGYRKQSEVEKLENKLFKEVFEGVLFSLVYLGADGKWHTNAIIERYLKLVAIEKGGETDA